MHLPEELIVVEVGVLLVLVWTFLIDLLELWRCVWRLVHIYWSHGNFITNFMATNCDFSYLLKKIVQLSYTTNTNLHIFLFAVICKCNCKLLWRPWEDSRTDSAWNEWWLDKNASSHGTSTPYNLALFQFFWFLVCSFLVLFILSISLSPSSHLNFIMLFLKVLASQKQLENRYKAAQQASEDW